MALNTSDLTQHPPRSPRVRLGGYVILPRMLDKGRATIAGKHGEYKFACPLDQRFLDLVGLKADALKKQLAAGKGDGEILEWIQKNAKHKPTDAEIAAWSEFAERRVPSDAEYVAALVAQAIRDGTTVAPTSRANGLVLAAR